MIFDEKMIERYSRQIILPEVGGKGQERLLRASVLIVGIGGLGSPIATYLAGAGIGKLGIVDSDNVEISNLHRQILYTSEDIGKKKVFVAKERLKKINSDIEIISYPIRLTSENIIDIIKSYDIIVDGSDNFPTRYLVNDACYLMSKILVFGAFFRYEGQAMVIKPGEGPCLRCLFPHPPPPGLVPSCQEAGVLGALAGIIGLIQASEVLKIILNIGDSLIGKLLIFDALKMEIIKFDTKKVKDCPLCGENPTIKELIDYEQFCNLKSVQNYL